MFTVNNLKTELLNPSVITLTSIPQKVCPLTRIRSASTDQTHRIHYCCLLLAILFLFPAYSC
jgi:hypothetical protein